MNLQVLFKHFPKVVWGLVSTVSVFSLVFSFASLKTSAQAVSNPINLQISAVTKDGQFQATRAVGNDWIFDGELGLSDTIRYRWKGVDINLKYKTSPVLGGGYLKVYLDSVSEANLLIEQGTDNYPMKISDISGKLKNGLNKILFVYVNPLVKDPFTPVAFTFNYKDANSQPKIEVLKPQPGAVFMGQTDQSVVIKLTNFKLVNQEQKQTGIGRMMVYFNEVNGGGFLGTIKTSSAQKDGTFEVRFSETDIDFSKIPDSPATKLIFVLVDSQEKEIGAKAEISVQTNYKGSADVGLPKITIIEPNKDRSDLSTTGETKFLVAVENFKILTERPAAGGIDSTSKEGFLQIIVVTGDKSEPLQPIWGKTSFTLNEIGFSSDSEGQKKVVVQLVDKNFQRLKPQATDQIDVFYKPATASNSNSSVDVQNNTWRIAIIIMTVVLIIGGITILITKG